MKILHIEAGKHLYGGGLQVVYLIKALFARGIENVLVCPLDADVLTICDGFCELNPIIMKGDLDVCSITRIRAVIRLHEPDLIHVHSRRGADLFGLIAAKLEQVPVLLSRRVDNTEPSWFAKIKYPYYNQVAVISEAIRSVLVSQGVSDSHMVTIPDAVDTQCFYPVSGRDYDQGRKLIHQRFGLAENTLVIAVVAQLIKRKGHDVLLDTLPQIFAKHRHCHVVFFGRGPREQALRFYVDNNKLVGKVTFAGFCDDMQNIIPYVDLLVHPAFKEGMGVVLLQAGACAIPVVATRAGGIPEIIEHSINGLLVEPGNTQQLAQAICTLLANHSLRRTMGEAGRQVIESQFSVDIMAEAYLKIYRSLLERDDF